MLELYRAMDLFVLSSLREGLPNVILEAMAMEVPVVSTSVGGIPELIQDGRTGLLCPANNAVALARIMEQALIDLPLRERLAQAGRRLVEDQHSFSQRMARVQAIYARVLGS
jgi:glycosyltransferase involved in cell wall biosynthesis